jgi:diguanylate cyclase (GGDEF)-like protein/PAS domain S-box-containing protein
VKPSDAAPSDEVAPASASARGQAQATLGRVSHLLGGSTALDLGSAIEECLGEIATWCDVDAAFVLLVDDDEQVTDQWLWAAPGRPSVTARPGGTLQDTLGPAVGFLRIGHGVAVDDLQAIELEPSQRSLTEDKDLRAILIAPVRVGFALLGVIGLQHFGSTRRWSGAQLSQLELVGELVAQAVQRTRDRGRLAAADARARRIAEHLPDGLVLVDPRGSVTWVSPAFERSSGRPAAELVGTSALELVHPDDQQRLAGAMYQHPERGEGVSVRVHAADAWRWTDLSWTLMHDADRTVEDELVVSLRDVHDKHLRDEALARQSRQDTLTGTLNRVGLEDALAPLVAAHQQVLVGFVDVDAFKTVNDTSGHSAGDEVLRSVAHALRGAVRASDHVARLGGDEFCVVASCDHELDGEAAVLAERLLDAVRAALAGTATVSMGLAGPGRASAADALMAAADAAMYRAKRAGGDSCELDDTPVA